MTANHDIYSRRSLKRGTPNNDDAVPVVEAAYASWLRSRSLSGLCVAALLSRTARRHCLPITATLPPRPAHYRANRAEKLSMTATLTPAPTATDHPRLPDPRIPAPNRMANFVEVPSEPKAEEMTQTCNEGVKRRHGTSDSSVNIAPLEMIEGATESQRQGEGAREVSAKCHQTQKVLIFAFGGSAVMW